VLKILSRLLDLILQQPLSQITTLLLELNLKLSFPGHSLIIGLIGLNHRLAMPIVTINDLKAKSATKRGRKMGIATVNDGEYLQLGKGSELIESKTGKAAKQVRSNVILVVVEALLTHQKDEDGNYRDEHEKSADESLEDVGTSREKAQKQGSGGEADKNGNVYLKLTPRQMAALHWVNQDFKPAASEVNQAVGGTEQNEEIKASHVAGADEQGGGEVKAGADCGEPIIGELRNGKKRDIGRRLGEN
jgi:sulfite reductase beta subunit-like hemoprotein